MGSETIVARRVFVVRSTVEWNAETGSDAPVFLLIDDDGREYRGSNIGFEGPSVLQYDPSQAYGKRVWIETFGKVVLTDGLAQFVFSSLVEVGEPEADTFLGSRDLS
jgi:hypothetical protein